MARKHPNQPRRRPGHRPPGRRGAPQSHGPRPPGFTHAAMRPLFDAVLPMQGKERREFFNTASTGLVVGSWAGFIGAVIGFGVGATIVGLFVEKQRYYRR